METTLLPNGETTSLDIRPAPEDAFATIPIALISRDTLSFVGLSNIKADEIWDQWTNWPSFPPSREIDPDDGGPQIPFFDFICGQLENYKDVDGDDDAKWRQCLDQCGIDTAVQEAIMDPKYKNIRLTNSCLFWLRDTIEMRYAHLEGIKRASRQPAVELRRVASQPNNAGSNGRGGRRGGRGGSSQQAGHNRGESAAQGQQQQMMPGISTEHWSSRTVEAVINKPGYTVLFKGMDQARIVGLFDDNGALKGIQKLLSSWPSDFSGTRSFFYFTSDYEVAEYYAAYARRRANNISTVMICLSIPKDAIENLEAPDIQRLYWPASQWKQLVWWSKTQRSLRKYRNALLIIGTISKGPDRIFQEMQTWEDMTDDCVLRVGPSNRSRPAVQYVFSGEEEGREFLIENSKIEVFPFSEADS